MVNASEKSTLPKIDPFQQGKALYITLVAYSPSCFCTLPLSLDNHEFYSRPARLFQNPWGLPQKLDFSVYAKVWTDFNIGHALLNSIRLSTITVSISLLFTLTASFAISRMQWRFSNVALAFLLSGLMIPGHSTIIPLYLSLLPVIESFGARNAILVPYIAGTLPISVFIISSYMRSIPDSLEEAAVIDGCNIWQLFYKIIVPVSLPAIASVTIFNFLSVWNELMCFCQLKSAPHFT